MMEMSAIVVEHKWSDEQQEDLFKVVGDIVEKQKKGELPEGFSLNAINVVKGENRAICNWDAPDVNAMKQLIDQVNPPDEHRVYESQKIL